jgi:hypothetical protein
MGGIKLMQMHQLRVSPFRSRVTCSVSCGRQRTAQIQLARPDFEFGDSVQPFADKGLQLHARQRRPGASVDAGPESPVPLPTRPAVEGHRYRVAAVFAARCLQTQPNRPTEHVAAQPNPHAAEAPNPLAPNASRDRRCRSSPNSAAPPRSADTPGAPSCTCTWCGCRDSRHLRA